MLIGTLSRSILGYKWAKALTTAALMMDVMDIKNELIKGRLKNRGLWVYS